jgi:hypothetical protein
MDQEDQQPQGKLEVEDPKFNGKETLLQRIFKYHTMQTDDFVQSYFFPRWLTAILRILMGAYAFVVVVVSLSRDLDNGFWFAFFTCLNYLSLTIYFWVSSVLSVLVLWKKNSSIVIGKIPWIFRYLLWIQYHLLVTYHLVIVIVYWVLLSRPFLSNPPPSAGIYTNVSMHGLDVVFMWIEMVSNRHDFVLGNLIYGTLRLQSSITHCLTAICILILYMFYTWIIWLIPFPVNASYPNEY